MESLNKLIKTVKKYNAKYDITEKSSDAEKIRFELMKKGLYSKD